MLYLLKMHDRDGKIETEEVLAESKAEAISIFNAAYAPKGYTLMGIE